MTQAVFRKMISGDDPDNLCDVFRLLSGLSKIKIKDAMIKGAAWVHRPGGRRRRVRRATAPVRPGDVVCLYYDPDILAKVPPAANCVLDRTDYSIWYKPAGLMSQGSPYGDHCSLTYQIERHFSPKRTVYLVHRLDREASGLLIVAHRKTSAARLSDMLRKNRIEKRYRARVKGDLRSFSGKAEIDLPLDGRPAVTTFDAVCYDRETDTSTVEIRIRTGRLHQIRRHFDSAGYPVMGDPRYGKNNADPKGLQLTAHFLSFDCPINGTRVEHALDL